MRSVFTNSLFVLIILFSNTVLGQPKNTVAEDGYLVFGFTKTVQGKNEFIDPLNGGTIKGDELANAKHIIAFYKTPKTNLTIDSIYYKVTIYTPERDPIELDGSQFDIDYEKYPGSLIHRAGKINGSALIFTVSKIVLKGGEQIRNPEIAKKRTFKAKDFFINGIKYTPNTYTGIVFTVSN